MSEVDSKFLTRFAVVLLVNSLVVYLAAIVFPANVVLGTYQLSPLVAAVLTGLLVTLFSLLLKSLRKQLNFKLKGREQHIVFYWLVNSVGLWLFAQLAPFTGFGISAFYWAFVIGAVLTLGQWITRQLFKSQKLI